MLQVRLLGQFDVCLNDVPLTIPSRAAQTLLAYLILHPGVPRRREQLAGMLWPDSEETTARKNLRHVIWLLRSTIGEHYIVADRITVAFDAASSYWLDVALLQSTLHTNTPLEELLNIANLYQGHLLSGFYDDWIMRERERYALAFEQQMKLLLAGLEAEQRWEEVLKSAGHWLALDNTAEHAYQALMRAHHACGDNISMVEMFNRCTAILADELEVEPSAETVSLYNELTAAHRLALDEALVKPLNHNLPAETTSFIGREKLLDHIVERLEKPDCRLVTLTGPGGIGKTRLAIQVAATQLGAYEHGVYMVDLSPVHDPDLVPSTIATTLDIKVQRGANIEDVLLRVLGDKRLLLVLDNFEQVIGAALLVSKLLTAAPQLKILVTSRELLRVYGEHSFPVPELSYPRNGTELDVNGVLTYDAVRLFSQRAKAASPDFEITDDNVVVTAAICTHLEGIPLALELAADKVRLFKVDTLYERLSDRFKVMQDGARDLPDRQQTLRSTIDWSYNLLNEKEQALFTRLGVFVGGWSFQAAEAICGDDPLSKVISRLESLQNKNLIRRAENISGVTRFSMLETIREYAVERLAGEPDEDILRAAHLKYFMDLAEQSAEPLRAGQDVAFWLDQIETDHENIRAALSWSIASDHYIEAVRLAYAAWHFWWYRGHYPEANRWYKRLLVYRDQLTEDMLADLLWAASFASDFVGDSASWSILVRELVALQRKRADQAALADALKCLSFYELLHGDLNAAQQAAEESLALARAVDDSALLVNTLNVLGQIANTVGNHQQASEHYEEALTHSHRIGDFRTASLRLSLASIRIQQGDTRAAKKLLASGFAFVQLTDLVYLKPWLIEEWAGILLAENIPEDATRLLGAAWAHYTKSGIEPDITYEPFVAQAREMLGTSTFEQLFKEGQAISIDEAIEYITANFEQRFISSEA